jgi:hypothetical protein
VKVCHGSDVPRCYTNTLTRNISALGRASTNRSFIGLAEELARERGWDCPQGQSRRKHAGFGSAGSPAAARTTPLTAARAANGGAVAHHRRSSTRSASRKGWRMRSGELTILLEMPPGSSINTRASLPTVPLREAAREGPTGGIGRRAGNGVFGEPSYRASSGRFPSLDPDRRSRAASSLRIGGRSKRHLADSRFSTSRAAAHGFIAHFLNSSLACASPVRSCQRPTRTEFTLICSTATRRLSAGTSRACEGRQPCTRTSRPPRETRPRSSLDNR